MNSANTLISASALLVVDPLIVAVAIALVVVGVARHRKGTGDRRRHGASDGSAR